MRRVAADRRANATACTDTGYSKLIDTGAYRNRNSYNYLNFEVPICPKLAELILVFIAMKGSGAFQSSPSAKRAPWTKARVA
jgi:hypothetical protein